MSLQKIEEDYFILEQKLINSTRNDQISNFIREMQFKIKVNQDVIFEWIPYNQFDEIIETGKNCFMTVYSAKWNNKWIGDYERDSDKEVILKCLHNSQNPIDSLIYEVKKYYCRHKFLKIYGMSQNQDTKDFVLVQNNFIWTSENKQIDNFVQKMQLEIKDNNDIVFEWIPYSQFYEIKETGKNGLVTVYSAIWKDGPLCYAYNDYKRNMYEKVALKCWHNSENPIESLINEVKKHTSNKFGNWSSKIYGISQNSDTNEYILVFNWTSGNEKIDDFIQEMQFEANNNPVIVYEWIPYNQFNKIKKIGKGGFSTIYLAIWKYNKVALKCLDNSQILVNELLNEVKAYSTKVLENNSRILKVYGISQDPDTKNYIIVLQYVEGGNFNHWLNTNENYKFFDWENKMRTLYNIASGLKEIHEKHMVHRDFHTGNILFNTPSMEEYANRIYISDMGLCGKVSDINKTNIYGVMPYMAPEVLRGKPYTQAADIYSFGMIMHFVAAGIQPFSNRAHDHHLALDLINGIRPEINEPEAPKSYIDLMKECWNINPENRPNIAELTKSLWSITIKNSEIERAENYRNLELSSESLKEDRQITTHPKAIYTSRLLNPFTENLPKYNDGHSECLDCEIPK